MNFDRKKFANDILHLQNEHFEAYALQLFRFQATHNTIYRQYIKYLGKSISDIQTLKQVPFLPIEFFKFGKVVSNSHPPAAVFESSGTTGQERSKHYVHDLALYEAVAKRFFEQLYGSLSSYHIFALLPSYLERGNSSLVAMVKYFMDESASPEGGFYLDNVHELIQKVETLKNTSKRKILIIGVTFALLDLAAQFQLDWSKVNIMETGGMKGRKKEMVRDEVHHFLKEKLNVAQVHSEYGMTELLSQAYAQKGGYFQLPNWLRFYLRDVNDPFCIDNTLSSGAINIVDLANIDSCAFIETKDIGKQENGYWQILGRIDNSDIRGCNLLVL